MPSIRQSRPAIEVAALLAHAATSRYKRRLDEAQAIVRRGFDLAPDAYVSLSLGKDSAVVAHLCLAMGYTPPLRLLTFDESEFIGNFAATRAEWQCRFDVAIETIHIARANSTIYTNSRAVMDTDQRGGVLLGLRADESRARRMSLKAHGVIHQYKDTGMYRICPLAHWGNADVAAYIMVHDLPVLAAYHEHGFTTRTSSAIPIRNSQARRDALTRLRQDAPQRFEQLAELFSEVREWV